MFFLRELILKVYNINKKTPFFNKVTLKLLQHGYSPVNIATFLKTAFVIEQWWLLSS